LLAVDEKQLSPSRIVLVVGEGGMFSVKSVHLKRADSDPALDWVSKMHKTVAEDVAYIQANPLYNNSCSSTVHLKTPVSNFVVYSLAPLSPTWKEHQKNKKERQR